jgi:hypothetical protein
MSDIISSSSMTLSPPFTSFSLNPSILQKNFYPNPVKLSFNSKRDETMSYCIVIHFYSNNTKKNNIEDYLPEIIDSNNNKTMNEDLQLYMNLGFVGENEIESEEDTHMSDNADANNPADLMPPLEEIVAATTSVSMAVDSSTIDSTNNLKVVASSVKQPGAVVQQTIDNSSASKRKRKVDNMNTNNIDLVFKKTQMDFFFYGFYLCNNIDPSKKIPYDYSLSAYAGDAIYASLESTNLILSSDKINKEIIIYSPMIQFINMMKKLPFYLKCEPDQIPNHLHYMREYHVLISEYTLLSNGKDVEFILLPQILIHTHDVMRDEIHSQVTSKKDRHFFESINVRNPKNKSSSSPLISSLNNKNATNNATIVNILPTASAVNRILSERNVNSKSSAINLNNDLGDSFEVSTWSAMSNISFGNLQPEKIFSDFYQKSDSTSFIVKNQWSLKAIPFIIPRKYWKLANNRIIELDLELSADSDIMTVKANILQSMEETPQFKTKITIDPKISSIPNMILFSLCFIFSNCPQSLKFFTIKIPNQTILTTLSKLKDQDYAFRFILIQRAFNMDFWIHLCSMCNSKRIYFESKQQFVIKQEEIPPPLEEQQML